MFRRTEPFVRGRVRLKFKSLRIAVKHSPQKLSMISIMDSF